MLLFGYSRCGCGLEMEVEVYDVEIGFFYWDVSGDGCGEFLVGRGFVLSKNYVEKEGN